jgi:hypothetical protein
MDWFRPITSLAGKIFLSCARPNAQKCIFGNSLKDDPKIYKSINRKDLSRMRNVGTVFAQYIALKWSVGAFFAASVLVPLRRQVSQ